MTQLLPTISMSDLQRCAKERLESIKDYAVIQRHGKDVAFVLHPNLGKILMESGLLEVLKSKLAQNSLQKSEQIISTDKTPSATPDASMAELDRILGQVLKELSKR